MRRLRGLQSDGQQKNSRPGLYYCNPCEKTFTVTVGTLFERSHVPLNKWALAYRLMASTKKGISADQLHRSIDVTYKSAWFMAHRIREAMRERTWLPPMGGSEGKVVEDEAFIGPDQAKKRSRKLAAVTQTGDIPLVERGGEPCAAR